MQATLAQIPWYHHLTLLEKVPDEATRLHYVAAAAQHGWSRDVMVHQIETDHRRRQGRAVTNFARTLPIVANLEQRLSEKLANKPAGPPA